MDFINHSFAHSLKLLVFLLGVPFGLALLLQWIGGQLVCFRAACAAAAVVSRAFADGVRGAG